MRTSLAKPGRPKPNRLAPRHAVPCHVTPNQTNLIQELNHAPDETEAG